MAAYTVTTGAATAVRRAMEIWNNTTDEIILRSMMDIILAEFLAMQTAGLAGYTVTTGLEATLLSKLNNISNNTMRLCMQDFLGYLLAEFTLVQTNGLAYEVTDTSYVAATGAYGAVDGMRQSVYNWPNSTHQIALNQIIDIISTELEALEDAAP